MTDWQKWETLLKNNQGKSLRELEPIFNKTHAWISNFKTFYYSQNKEDLKDKHKQYSFFYKKWRYHLARSLPVVIKPKEEEPETLILIKKIFKQFKSQEEIDKVKFILTDVLLENKHLIEEINALQEDNLTKAKNINQLINHNNELEEKLKFCNTTTKIFKILFYSISGISILLTIIGGIKCLD